MLEPYEQLERELSAWSGMPYVAACSSGTAALHLALEAIQMPPGSTVVLPDYTMVACPRAVAMAGLTPVLVDCGDDLLMDPNRAEKPECCRSPSRIKHHAALMLVHIYGRVCSQRWVETAVKRGSKIIEDLAEAHGVKPHPATDAACWSFYRNKIVAGEEGGAVGFREEKYAERARQLRSLGFTLSHDFQHIPRGHNYRLANSLAIPISNSLARIDANLYVRRRIERTYNETCPPEWRMPRREVPWVYDIRIPGMTREVQDRVVRALNKRHVPARHGFKPMSSQEEFRNCRVVGKGNAARLESEIVYLPIQPGVTSEVSIRMMFGEIRDSLQ